MANVILITVDSLRADAVLHDDSVRDSLTSLRSLADDGLVYTDAYANAPYTSHSFLSILGGTYQWRYGDQDGFEPERPHLAERFSEAGYRTAGFHSNTNLNPVFGFDRGFDRYPSRDGDSATEGESESTLAKLRVAAVERFQRSSSVFQALNWTYESVGSSLGIELGGMPYTPAERINDQVVEWVRRTDGERFVWAHYMDVHIPYYPHEGTVSAGISSRRATKVYHKARKSPERITDDERRLLQRLYRGEVKRLDTRIGDLLDRLDRRMPMDDTYIVFASDHGEAFGEHDIFFHGGKLHQELIHVPLIVSGPEIDREVVNVPVSNLDIMPTLLELADADVPGDCDGDSIHRRAVPDDRAVFAEAYSPSMGRMMAYDGRWKYVETRSSGQQALFDLETDAGEQRNLIGSRTEELHRLRETADDHRESVLSEEPQRERRRIEVSEVAKHRLRRLGYDE